MWSVSEYTVRRMVLEGRLPAYRIGGQYRIPLDAVETMAGKRPDGTDDREARA